MLRKVCLMQYNLNELIDKNWLFNRSEFDFYLALKQELSELIDTYPWKWWKYMEDDINNRKIELVDAFHFIVSYWLLKINKYTNAGVDELVNSVSTFLSNLTEYIVKPSYKSVIDELNDIIRIDNEFLINPTDMTMRFFRLVRKYFNNFEDFYSLYFAKNILNEIRQEFGYKLGDYQKILQGKEDNYYIVDIVKKYDDVKDFNEFKTKVKEEFLKIYKERQ